MQWSEVQITTTPEAEDAVAELFYEAGAGGVAIENSNDINDLWNNPLVGYIDESILNRPENTSLIRGYFPNDEKTEERIREILLKISKLPMYGLNTGSAELKILEVEDEDWANSWKKYFFATHVTDKFVVVPNWDKYKATEEEIIIKLDPGMAFGTGTHETTKLCAYFLEQYCKEGDLVIDVGTGSGILSIIAAKLGAKEVLAVDIDPVAIKVANENISKNNCSDQIKTLEKDLLTELNMSDSIDLIVANILPKPIIDLLPQAHHLLKKNGIFICSGIIKDAQTQIIEKLEEYSFGIQKIKELGEWIGIAAIKL